MLGGALVQLPAIWVVIGIAAAGFGIGPRFAVLGWVALVLFLLLGEIGPLLQLSQRIMNVRAWLSGLAVLSIVLAACGDDGNEARMHTPEALSAVLLTADDLGPGWTEQQRDTFTTREPENPSIDGSLWCPDAAKQDASLQKLAGDAGADVELEQAQGRGWFQSLRQQAWSNSDVSEYFKTARAAIKACTGATWTSEGAEYTIEPLAGPMVGDESVSTSVVIVNPSPGGDMVSRSRISIARFGTALMVLQQGDVQSVDAKSQPTETEWQVSLEKAAAKIAALDTK